MKLSPKMTVPLLALIGFGGVSASLFAQYVLGMNPCVMCIEQRMALLGIWLVAMLCLMLPAQRFWARTTAAIVISVPAVFGLMIALQQTHLQSLPLSEQPDCGAPWSFRLRRAPLFDWYEPLIRGTGICGEIYQVFGISLPVWSALFFSTALLLVWGLWWHHRRVA